MEVVLHYYQFNIGDYKSHTSYLTPIEDLAYRRLLDEIYLHEKPLNNNLGLLSKIIGLPENKPEIETVLKMFFSETEKGWVNNRAMKEIKSYKSKAKTARDNGKKGGRPKKPKKTQSVNLANPEETGLKAKHKTRNIKQETLNNKQIKDISSEPNGQSLGILKCTKNEDFHIYQKDIDLWVSAYPAVDINQELNKIRAWLLSNPTKIKTKRGMPKFINNWLSRTQDKGGNNGQHKRPNQQSNDKYEIARQLSDPDYALENW